MIIDPRLAIGGLLVVGSIAGVVGLVAASDSTIDVYVTPDAVVPGDRITASDLEIHSASIGILANRYVRPGEIPADGLIATRPIAAGELIPESAVGSTDSARLAPVVISSSGALPAALEPGVAVDLWAAREDEKTGDYATPTVLVPAAVVVRLVSADTIVAGADVTAIELLVPKADVARVLEALANEAVLSVVPTSLPADD